MMMERRNYEMLITSQEKESDGGEEEYKGEDKDGITQKNEENMNAISEKDCIVVYVDENKGVHEGERKWNSIPIDLSFDQSPPSPEHITLDDDVDLEVVSSLSAPSFRRTSTSSIIPSVEMILSDDEEEEEHKNECVVSDEEDNENDVEDMTHDNSSKMNPELVAILFEMGYQEEQIHHVLKRCNSISAAVEMLNPDDQSLSETYRAQCPICFDECPLSEMITLDCLHRLCLTCFSSYCETKIKENEVLSDQLCCPILISGTSSSAPSKICAHPITVHEIKANISPEIFEKYERFITKSFCVNEKLTSCPKCNEWYVDLQEVLHLEHTWNSIKCEKCQHKFCGKCGQVPHKGQYDQDIDCNTYAKWLESNTKTDDNFIQYIQQNKLFACPKCGMYGALESGCKFMYCRCKENYCALCGEQLKQSEHFSHFSGITGATGPFGNKCLGMKAKADSEQAKAPVPQAGTGLEYPNNGREKKKGKKKNRNRVNQIVEVENAMLNPLNAIGLGVGGALDAARRMVYAAPPPAPVPVLPPRRRRGKHVNVVAAALPAAVVVAGDPPPPVPDNYPNTRRRGRQLIQVEEEDEEEQEEIEIKQEGGPQKKRKRRRW